MVTIRLTKSEADKLRAWGLVYLQDDTLTPKQQEIWERDIASACNKISSAMPKKKEEVE